jgi:mannan endo-1,4-beta-mannosidase
MPSRRSLVLALALTACGGDSGGTGPDTVPGAVSNLAAQVVGSEIKLTWSAAAGAASYSIYMASQSGVTRVNHTTLPGNMFHPDLQLSFDHPPGLDAGTLYFFVVTARNARGESIESCEVSAQINGAAGGSC